MRPIILEKDKDGRLQVTADEIKKMVDNAYEEGYVDGRKSVQIYPQITYPSNQPLPYTNPCIDRDHIVITCESLPVHLQT